MLGLWEPPPVEGEDAQHHSPRPLRQSFLQKVPGLCSARQRGLRCLKFSCDFEIFGHFFPSSKTDLLCT